MLDHEGKEVPGNKGYKYFGAARDLPGVRELFEQERKMIVCVSIDILLHQKLLWDDYCCCTVNFLGVWEKWLDCWIFTLQFALTIVRKWVNVHVKQ